MKILLSFIALFCSVHLVQAQLSVEDAKGKSSVVVKNSSIDLDIGEANLSAGFNNLRQQSYQAYRHLLWGVSAGAKNKDGLGSLLAGGNFSPDAKCNAFLAIKLNGTKKEAQLQKDIDELQKKRWLYCLQICTGLSQSDDPAVEKIEPESARRNKKTLLTGVKNIFDNSRGIKEDIADLQELSWEIRSR